MQSTSSSVAAAVAALPVLPFSVEGASSEHEVHVASHLERPETYLMWRTAGPERKARVHVRLAQGAARLGAIEVVNADAAFVEVLVSSAGGPDAQTHVLVPTSTLRTLVDMRNATNSHARRVFTYDAHFNKTLRDQAWRYLTFVVTQPLGEPCSIGLSAITLRAYVDPAAAAAAAAASAADASAASGAPAAAAPHFTVPTIGKTSGMFHIPEVADAQTSSATAAAALAAATDAARALAEKQQAKVQNAVKLLLQHQQQTAAAAGHMPASPAVLLPSSLMAKVPVPQAATAPQHQQQQHKRAQTSAHATSAAKKLNIDGAAAGSSSAAKATATATGTAASAPPPAPAPAPAPAPSASAAASSSPATALVRPRVAYAERAAELTRCAQKGVVLVISGIVNPERAELRQILLDMGGDYRPQWTKDSTHLVCNMANTPKHVEAESAGGICVRKEWLYACRKQGARVPVNEFLLSQPSAPVGAGSLSAAAAAVSKASPTKPSAPPKAAPQAQGPSVVAKAPSLAQTGTSHAAAAPAGASTSGAAVLVVDDISSDDGGNDSDATQPMDDADDGNGVAAVSASKPPAAATGKAGKQHNDVAGDDDNDDDDATQDMPVVPATGDGESTPPLGLLSKTVSLSEAPWGLPVHVPPALASRSGGDWDAPTRPMTPDDGGAGGDEGGLDDATVDMDDATVDLEPGSAPGRVPLPDVETEASNDGFPCFFRGCRFVVGSALQPATARKARRFVLAYDGECVDETAPGEPHFVLVEPQHTPAARVAELKARFARSYVVSAEFVDECHRRQVRVDPTAYT